MISARLGRAMATGLILVAAGATATAQDDPSPVPPQELMPAPAVPAPQAGASVPAGIFEPGVGAPGPGMLAPRSSPATCPCGGRRSLFGHPKHRVGCKRHWQETFLGFAEEFNEWPLGRSLYTHGQTMVANGDSARSVFYHYDFVEGTDRLNLRGRDKLLAMATRLPVTFDPVIIERTPREPGLDQKRRLSLLAQLATGPFPVPPERVVIGLPIADGLPPPDALLINGNRLASVGSGGGLSNLGGDTTGFDASGIPGSAVTAAPGAVAGAVR